MEKIVQQGILYDYYGSLLTGHQQQIYEDAVSNDLSLSELADEYGITRQGIHDLIRRCDKILADYEDKLGCIKRDRELRNKAKEIVRACDAGDTGRVKDLASELAGLLNSP